MWFIVRAGRVRLAQTVAGNMAPSVIIVFFVAGKSVYPGLQDPAVYLDDGAKPQLARHDNYLTFNIGTWD